MTQYGCIVADPPWTPAMSIINGGAPKASPQRHYPTMDLDAIKRLRVPAADQAHLYLWALTPHVDWAFDVARAWGFEPLTMLTWCKPGLGVGRFRCNTEHVVLARKGDPIGNPFGSGGRYAQATAGTYFRWPRGRHSQKPDELFQIAERLSPGPRLELFARSPRLGWHVWGNEVQSDIELVA